MSIPFTIYRRRRYAGIVARLAGLVLALIGLDAFGQSALPPLLAPPPIYPPPPAPPPPRGYVTPVGRPGDWASDNDYPVAALRRHETGRAGFVLTVDAQGMPSDCQITLTTHYPDLDQATCDVMMRRARFRPPLDAQGKPTTGTWRSSVNWAIPQDAEPAPRAGTVALALDVMPDGTIANCTANDPDGTLATLMGGDFCLKRQAFAPLPNKAGKPVKQHVRIEMRVDVTDAP